MGLVNTFPLLGSYKNWTTKIGERCFLHGPCKGVIWKTVEATQSAQTPGVYLGLFADATDRKEGYVLRKLQRGFSVVETWCERWDMKINEDSGHLHFS
jgi:hypothetical protein